MAYDRSKYQRGNQGNQGNQGGDRQRDDMEFILLQQFTPVNKGKRGRIVAELTKAVNHTRREEYVFVKFADQYQAKDGSWRYSGKNPSIPIDALDEIGNVINEIMEYIAAGMPKQGAGQEQPPRQPESKGVSDLRSRISGKGSFRQPPQDEKGNSFESGGEPF